MKLPELPQRWWLAIPILVAAIGLSWLLNRGEESPPAKPGRTDARVARPPDATVRSRSPAAPQIAPEPVAAQPIADIFAARTWEPPPPIAAEAPAAPQAPPLPFRFIGRIAVPGKGTAFMLANGDEVVVAQVGQAIGKDYRIEKFEKGQLLFRYRPLNVRQSLAIGGAAS